MADYSWQWDWMLDNERNCYLVKDHIIRGKVDNLELGEKICKLLNDNSYWDEESND